MSKKTVSTTCGFCSTGCNLNVNFEDNQSTKIVPNSQYPVNYGTSCPKGFLFLEPLKAHDRAMTPYQRNNRGEFEPVDWDRALQAFTHNFKEIQKKHGKESVAFIGSGQLPTEETAFLGALAKFGMGLIHGDGNTRQCMASAAIAYKQSFGFDAPPFTYRDFEESDVLVFIGANLAICHPVMWNRVKRNKKNPAIILVDPRRTETSKKATQHYQIKPEGLLTLLYGIAYILIENNWIDSDYIKRHTIGYEEFQKHVRGFDQKTVSHISGLTEGQINEFAQIIHGGKRVSFWWSMGVNQNYQGVRCAQAIINIALMTANIGKPGTGANSITGQCNAMGSRIFSNTTSLLGGYDFTNSNHRHKVAHLLGIDEKLIPRKSGQTYDEILHSIEKGRIKGLWIVCTNPAHSWIDKNGLFKILNNLEYLVVQDLYHTTETAQLSNLILPAAGCGEKEGTFINAERRLGTIRKIMDPPGCALPDFEIFQKIAEYWGCSDLFKEWSSPAAVFEILKRVSRGQPSDISGVSDYSMIEKLGGIQWPFPSDSETPEKERRLYEDGKFYHHDEKARFLFGDVGPVPEAKSEEYPFILLTGRGSIAQWHTQTRTGKVKKLKKMYTDELYVRIHTEDARRLEIESGNLVIVSSERSKIEAKALVGDNVKPGILFMPMHYFETNKLTYPAFDPFSREPSYKYAAVRIDKL